MLWVIARSLIGTKQRSKSLANLIEIAIYPQEKGKGRKEMPLFRMRLKWLQHIRGALHLDVYEVCHSVTSWSRSCYYTPYGSYGNPLSYEVW